MTKNRKYSTSGLKVTWQIIVMIALAIVIGIGVNQVRSDRLPLIGDWSQEARLKTPSGESMAISLEEAEAAFTSGGAIFVDARSTEDYRGGHISGALSLPWQEFDVYFDRVLPNLFPGITIITYCDGETCDLSKHLAEELFNMGYENVRVLVNGWSVWHDAQLPVESGPGSLIAGEHIDNNGI